jgi:hypothetical protein
VFGPELDVDAPVLVSAVGDQTVAAAAFDGERFLVAWRARCGSRSCGWGG